MRTSPRNLFGALLSAVTLLGVPGEALAISRDQVLARAQPWLGVVPYCQAPNGGYDSDCGVTCNRPPNAAWDPYRSDCSGYISYAWGLPAPGKVVSGLVAVSHTIAASELKPGDALASDGHIMLFIGWVNGQSQVKIWHEGDCGQTASEKVYNVSSVSGSTVNAWDSFTAIRFNEIVDTSPWQAEFVAQSWAPGTGAPVEMTVGETQTGWVKLKNTGSETWPAGVVKFAPMPRDKDSDFRSPSWPSATRASVNLADVKPGETAQFGWDLTPAKAGDFKPYFSLVAEGITWFADSGGPSDATMWVNLHVSAPPPGVAGAGGAGDAGGASSGAGGVAGASGKGVAGAGGSNDAGAGGSGSKGGSAGHSGSGGSGGKGGAGTGGKGGKGGSGGKSSSGASSGAAGQEDEEPTDVGGLVPTGESESGGGCSVSTRAGQPWAAGLLAALCFVRWRRRR